MEVVKRRYLQVLGASIIAEILEDIDPIQLVDCAV